MDPFSSVTEPRVHTPEVGEYLKLKCSPPKSYPEGDVYWARGGSDMKTSSRNRVAANARIALDYEGNLAFLIGCYSKSFSVRSNI